MTDASVGRWSWRETATASPVTVALFLSAAVMIVTGVASALGPVPSVVTATYYVSVFVVVALMWVHGLRTARQM
ncbi:hypothetical protein [Halovivax sp.]|uniref:hypothetical protein n=1 Tax=Halovivax sp. TaxID=1935978 RepID=UPI0025C34F4D|nr:hypothetical protein [Halovivax sp.]